MDWISCNSCFSQPNRNIKFFLTSCGHIFCENCGCFVLGTMDCCKECKNKCATILIGDKLFCTDPRVKEYFQDLEKKCETMINAIKFQKSHRLKLTEHHHKIVSKYNKAKLYIKKLENELMVTKNILRNRPHQVQKPYGVAAENQSVMPTTSNRLNSIPFKMVGAESKFQHSSNMKHRMPNNMKYRIPFFQNEFSLTSTESTESGIHASCSSAYSSPSCPPLQNHKDNNYVTAMDSLQIQLKKFKESASRSPLQFKKPNNVAAAKQSVVSLVNLKSNLNPYKMTGKESTFQYLPNMSV